MSVWALLVYEHASACLWAFGMCLQAHPTCDASARMRRGGRGGAPSLSVTLSVFQRLLCAHRTRGGIYNFMDVHKKRR